MGVFHQIKALEILGLLKVKMKQSMGYTHKNIEMGETSRTNILQTIKDPFLKEL